VFLLKGNENERGVREKSKLKGEAYGKAELLRKNHLSIAIVALNPIQIAQHVTRAHLQANQ